MVIGQIAEGFDSADHGVAVVIPAAEGFCRHPGIFRA